MLKISPDSSIASDACDDIFVLTTSNSGNEYQDGVRDETQDVRDGSKNKAFTVRRIISQFVSDLDR